VYFVAVGEDGSGGAAEPSGRSGIGVLLLESEKPLDGDAGGSPSVVCLRERSAGGEEQKEHCKGFHRSFKMPVAMKRRIIAADCFLDGAARLWAEGSGNSKAGRLI
jgi:hypothetical protein